MTVAPSPVLSAGGPRVDAWRSLGPQTALLSGCCGAVHWQADADWAFGHLELPATDTAPDAAANNDLTAAAHRAYRDVFAALNDCGRPQVLRLWNYLPRVYSGGGGLERYRQFNIGRQRSFIDAGRDAFEGVTACALGTAGAPASDLAGWVPPQPVENPRQVPACLHSLQHGPRAQTSSRAALTDVGGRRVVLFPSLSGTASIVGEQSLHPGDVIAKTEESLRNLQSTIYVHHAADAPAVLAPWARAVHGAGAPRCVQTNIRRAELLVEFEAHAFAPEMLT
jgi:hypothetical protein